MLQGGRGEEREFLSLRCPCQAKGKFYIVIPDIVNRESILFFISQKRLVCGIRRMRVPNFKVHTIFCDAGCRPGGRGPFVSAK